MVTVLVPDTLRPRQNGRQFPHDIFKFIFLNKNVWVSINISLKFVPKGPINNIPALVRIIAWRRPGDKPLSESIIASYWTIYASLGLNELINGWSWIICLIPCLFLFKSCLLTFIVSQPTRNAVPTKSSNLIHIYAFPYIPLLCMETRPKPICWDTKSSRQIITFYA